MTVKPLSKVAAILMALSIGTVLAVRADENKVAPSAEQVKADAEKAEKAAKEAAAKAEAEKAKAEAKAKEAAEKAEKEKAKAEKKAKEEAEKAKAKEEAAKAKEAEAKAKEDAAKAKAEAKAKEKAESAKKDEAKKDDAKPAEGKEGMTQGEAALALADKLGLFPSLPAGTTATGASAALTAQGISPFDGWKPGETLTVGDFAKVLVEAMGRGDEIPAEKKDKAEAYVDLLKGMGINVESGQEGIDEVGVLPEVFAAAVDGASNTSDPLRNRTVYGYPDERVSGTDALVSNRPQAGATPAPTPTPTPPAPRPRSTPTPTPRPPTPTPVDPTPVDPSPVITNT